MARNTLSLRARILLDAALASLFVLAFGLPFMEERLHELTGLAAFIAVAVHLIVGRAWLANLFRGAYTPRRFFTLTVNVLLLVAAMVVFGSGLVLFLGMGAGMGMRQAHTVAAHWTLVLSGIHVGLYWEKVAGGMRSMAKSVAGRNAWGRWNVWGLTGCLPKAGLLFALYGIWASFERSLGAKLFLGFSFDFWNRDWPTFLFFLNHLAVMGVYIAAARYAVRFTGKGRPGGGHEV